MVFRLGRELETAIIIIRAICHLPSRNLNAKRWRQMAKRANGIRCNYFTFIILNTNDFPLKWNICCLDVNVYNCFVCSVSMYTTMCLQNLICILIETVCGSGILKPMESLSVNIVDCRVMKRNYKTFLPDIYINSILIN